EQLAAKVRSYIGEVSELEVLGSNEFAVHVRAASTWRVRRVFLLGDAAHLLTPMWALGLNTGVLDASNLPWRLAWVLRGWADEALLDGYENEQKPLAIHGSGDMAEAARRFMAHEQSSLEAMTEQAWANAMTRTMLGMRLDVEGTGDWALASVAAPQPVRAGDRVPDLPVWHQSGQTSLHQLTRDAFVALYFTDARRRPRLPPDEPGLKHRLVSHWDAPVDSGLRDRALFDPGKRAKTRLEVDDGTVVLLRPDSHVAGVASLDDGFDIAMRLYRRITGEPARASEGVAHE
ncbi:MAG TPA: FAD-dependent monooxygenase, partial [Trueperaceae bacterium]|nr:FAD-dependent monooxygenase [Trueperaceae bacterium]